MADILLLYPKTGHDVRGVSVSAPLALTTVASHLVSDFSVKILDQRACDDFWGDLETELKSQPILVGITSMTGTQIFYGLEMSKFIRERSAVPIVWGGMHATILPAQTVSKPYIDFVLRGEGEKSLRALVQTLSRKETDYDNIPGLVWKKANRIYQTPQADPLDLDQSPKVPWHLVNVEEYTSPTQFLYPGANRLLPYQGSRGCPFKCTFCSEPILTRKFRMRKPSKIVDECLELVDKYKLDHITFFDEEFFINTKWANEMAEAINGKFTWWAQTRAADLLKVDLKKMERCGLLVIAPGLESGADRMLQFIRKKEKVEEYREANKKLAETKLQVQYNLIIGFPTETQQELNQTVDLVLHLLQTNKNSFINQLSPLTPLPGTELLAQVIKNYEFREPKRIEEWIQITRGKQERSW
ncbi:MAG: B12-binding domain-containing radical SAM protein, partial [Deltaproteobacteria bacterium]|nr:B12-binding domain-containing radical SAM protein [Deltaproteobacteria bacterium]